MVILVVAEQRDSKIKKSSFEAVGAAKMLADELKGSCVALVVGSGVEAVAGDLGAYGASRVLVVDSPKLARHSNSAYAKVIAEVAAKEQAAIVLLPASQMGKDLAPRVAVKLNAGLAADCVALRVENGNVIATRPVFAGKTLLDIKVKTPVKMFTLRPNVFAAARNGQGAAVEKMDVPLEDGDFTATVTEMSVATGRPDVTEADIIVSGGRGLKGPENFHLVEELADVLGAGVGASRAVVDAGWRPHDEQVGQTGKTVSPTMYVACGISGAVQHLAGMSSSKYIVAINKDKDAPIFQIADYGIVGDVTEILPELTAQLKQALGK
ncbi:MAG: Electron transfer flavoprotein subunit alpha [Bacteroidetes bacterium]|jgi:electron transfer flavoprotein alpha subunit|nr:Electron transfer flavoprotein subunit alpha [Bacteroidota bacterium]